MMRDEKDILKALKVCSDPDNDCCECPYRKVYAGCDVLSQDALDLIIKLQKENAALKAELEAAQQAMKVRLNDIDERLEYVE